MGRWTVGNRGAGPFGSAVREHKSPADLVRLLGEVGAYGVNFHDNDLIPIDATLAEHDQILKQFKKILADTRLLVPMATTNLFSDPIFKDGAFTSNDSKVRADALQKTMNTIYQELYPALMGSIDRMNRMESGSRECLGEISLQCHSLRKPDPTHFPP